MARLSKPKSRTHRAELHANAKAAKDAAQVESATPNLPASKRRRAYLPANERRRRIILAAQEVFSRTSLQGARTRELAKAAEVNQATLFAHFESKEDLFAAAVVQPLLEAMQGMRSRAQTYRAATSLKEMLALGQSSAHRHLESMMKIYPLLATALFSDPALGKKLYCEQIVPLLKERGEVMRGVGRDSVDPNLLALLSFGMFFAIAMDQTLQGKNDDLAAIAEQLSDLITFGFVPDRLRNKPSSK
jgi:AcrR family transcriptional regulator